MDIVREEVNEGILNNTPQNRKGEVSISLFDAIAIILCVFPVFIAMIGLENYYLKPFFIWVDFRIEEVDEEEQELRDGFGITVIRLEEIIDH
jgi:hypothetical protein